MRAYKKKDFPLAKILHTPAAGRVLKALAAGAPGTWPTHAAEGVARWARAGLGGPDETIKKRQP
jgi:hypothetical protein